MAARLFDHIDLRVGDLARVKTLYDAFFPAVGLSETQSGDDFLAYHAPGARNSAPFVWVNLAADHRPNDNRIAFWADSEEEVNRVGAIVREAGARVVEGPEYCHEYSPGYYAVFFEDADGNKWEVCCRNARVRSPVDVA